MAPPKPKVTLHKCNTCYASGTEKTLQKCARCRAAKYCSKECQRADWPKHKRSCQYNAELESALKEHDATPFGLLERLLLPNGISLHELDQRLEKWVRWQHPTLMWATIHALRLPDDLARARTHVLHVRLQARADHADATAKFFRVLDASVVPVADALAFREPWPASLAALRDMQEDSETMGRGRIAACMVECDRLAVQTVPFGSIRNLKYPVELRWKEALIQDVESGKKHIRRA
ncbi:uncharacterized protein C8Q71DRAFT_856660 [Rhodofomes roseus]|uniref:MYND-type domain-containing protein n=1 Tax=Rhodofomes roseus TaxID=34475 RepID=A0A4Y9XV79_9APHY|nr:uncharacterized protein C8Q71DRAFT_856660 [Rhodofomes roseus]KAH9838731.1 hypothetical protein C8Q71DRAFT_856660 [Rhodofomes roseus]TFY53985.1 hypothetical protein EVJ58_g9133 [Rhodofomes roseus]